MKLRRSGVGIRSVSQGLELSRPELEDFAEVYDSLRREFGASENGVIEIKQVQGIDADDRIALGTDVLRQLLDAGF